MRLRQAVRGFRDAEVAVLRVSAQAVGFEILLAVMADRDALLRPRLRFTALDFAGGSRRLGLDGLAG